MAKSYDTTSAAPMQPDLRSFIVYDQMPEGCTTFRLMDDHSEPHLRMGELAIIDPHDREPAAGELALIQYQPRRPEEAHRHRYIVEMRRKKAGWIVSPVQPERLFAVAGGQSDLPQRLRFWDGIYPAECLSEMLLGRVVGILQPSFAEPLRIPN